MPRNRILLLTSFLAVFLFASCTSLPKIAASDREALIAKQLEMSAKRHSYAGSGDIRWRSQKDSVTAPASLFVQYPDKIRLEVEDPFGSLQALLILNGNTFFWYEAGKKRAFRADVRNNNVQRLLTFPFISEDFVRVMLARPTLAKEAKLSADRTEFLAESANVRYSFRIDPQFAVLTRWQLLQPNRLVLAEYEEYERFADSVLAPLVTKLTLHEKAKVQAELVFRWQELDINTPLQEKMFQIPQQRFQNLPVKSL